MKDESQDTGYLILSLTEAMDESRRLRQELKTGVRSEQVDDGASLEEGGADATPPKPA